MRNIWKIFKRDCHLVRTNLIALVVAFGLVVIPSLYAWFNIAAEWEPYANTSGVRVAVANDDAGYKSELMPVSINVGKEVESALHANDQLEWVFTSSEEAKDGVSSGKYYAALVIPEDFSERMMGALSGTTEHARITYYSNQKESAIAPKVTDQGADTVRTTVNQTFTETVSEAGAGIAEQLAGYLDSDQVESFAGKLTSTLGTAASDLRQASSHVTSYGQLLESAGSLVDASGALLGTNSDSTASLKELIDQSKEGVSQIESSVKGATDIANEALDTSMSSFDDVERAVDSAFVASGEAASDASGELRAQAEKVDTAAAYFEDLASTLERIQDGLPEMAQPTLDVSIARANGAAQSAKALSGALRGAAGHLDDAVSGAESDRAAIKELIAQAKKDVENVDGSYEETVRTQAQQLASSVDSVSASALSVSESLGNTLSDLSAVASSTANGLSDATGSLSDASEQLASAADELDELTAKVNEALSSGDLQKVRDIIGSDPEGLAASLASPVGLNTQAIYPVENTGSSMAPYFTTLATWVGCVVLSAMLKVNVSKDALEELGGAKPYQVYFGRFLFFWMLGILQSTLIGLGDLFYLQIQCHEPLLFMCACWVASTVFMSIVYALVVSFGDVGKAVGVVFMVLQVAGAGGIFPVEVMPAPFQLAYPFLPFVHSMNLMKFAIAGGVPGTYATELGCLVAFVAPALLLGLVLRKPVVRLNHWFMEQLESTKVM